MASIDPWEKGEVDQKVDKLKQNIQKKLQVLDDRLKEGDGSIEIAKELLDKLVKYTEVKFARIKQLEESRELQGIEPQRTSRGGLDLNQIFVGTSRRGLDWNQSLSGTSRRGLYWNQALSGSTLQSLGKDSMHRTLWGSGPPPFLQTLFHTPLDDMDQASIGKGSLLEQEIVAFQNENGDTVAHTTVAYHNKPDFLKKLIEVCPTLLVGGRKYEFQGHTPLHAAIAGQNFDMTKAILHFLDESIRKVRPHLEKNYSELKSLWASKADSERHSQLDQTIQELRSQMFLYSLPLMISADGSWFQDTVMLGQLPLSVAALTLDKTMVNLLIDHGAKIWWKNASGENVLHSLVRYASIKHDKINEIWDMMRHITKKHSHEIQKKMWHDEMNSERQTPLKMAVALGLHDLFVKILKLDGIYHSVNDHDGLFGIHLYDVTEIDTVEQAVWEKYQNKTTGYHGEEIKDSSYDRELYHRSPSVLEIIAQLPYKRAFPFLYLDVVKKLIRLKWQNYKKFFFLWLVWHLIMMIYITIYIIYKTHVITSNDFYTNQTGNGNATLIQRTASKAEKDFVNASGGVIFLFACPYLIMELYRLFGLKPCLTKRYLPQIHHNGLYRVMMLIFSLALMIDTIWFYSRPQNNAFLILALITGWSFMIFFFRAFKGFSLYSFLYWKIISGDLVRLSILILFQLVGFSIALYITYQNAREVSSDFQDLSNMAVTMFKVMLGLSELEFLYQAKENWLAISLYVAFVLVAYIILFNSLIAMMSRTCGLVSRDKYQMWKLQRLSVILLLETMVIKCNRWRHLVRKEELEGYQLDIEHSRCYLEVTETVTLKNKPAASSGQFNLMSHTKGTQTSRQQDVDITRSDIPHGHHTVC